jgi:hypothetical protein
VITASAPLPTRVWAYLLERFPPVAYTVLVGLFAASAFALAARQAGTVVGLEDMSKSAAVVLLVFLHLRLMDEHKDHEADEKAYPERCLSRGVVTLPLLFRLGVVAVVIEALLAFSLSSAAAIAWAACLSFTLLMRFEFGVGAWLNRHLLVYAITHNPVVALLAAFLWVVAGGGVGPLMWLYIGVVSVGSLAFEIGRKIRLPEEEIDGVESYSSVLGKRRADLLLAALRLLTGVGLLGLGWVLGQSVIGALALGLQVVLAGLLLSSPRGAKFTEGIATVGLLLDFVLVWVMAW